MKEYLDKLGLVSDGIQPIEGKYSFDDFARIIAHLRSENGCPWDKVQTHRSLRQCVIEEAYEVAEAIDIYDESGDYDNLCEELGDIMLQAMMHSQIANEEGLFNMGNVIDRVCDKMIFRHSHVFGEVKTDNPKEALLNWEEMKKVEKGKQDNKSALKDIPRELPALIKSQKIIKKLDKLYNEVYDYQDGIDSIAKIVDELKNSNSSISNNEKNAELIGELLYQITGVSRELGVNAEECLRDKINNVVKKY